MKDIFLGYDLFGKNALWKDLYSNNSALIGGLSGSGKSFLTFHIVGQFLEQGFKVVVISDKAKVDFKDERIERIDTLGDQETLNAFIDETLDFLTSRKSRVETSRHTHSRFLDEREKLLIVVDEMWSINKLGKDLKKKFEDFCELIIRQGRYLSIFIIFSTQVSSVNETEVPIRQCSILLTGKTDTKQLSESLFGSDIAYTNDFLRQGYFVIWDRLSSPKIIKIGPKKVMKFSIYLSWILELLKKIWIMKA